MSGESTFWEQVATRSWGAYIIQMEHQFIADALSIIRSPSEALEIECEGGRWSKMLADAGWMMTCTDINQEMSKVCQTRIPGARVIVVDCSDTVLPCSLHQLNLLLCIGVPEVVNKDWFFPEANRVLRTGGLLVITCFNRLSWRGLYATIRGNGAALYQRTYLSSKRNLHKCGFTLLRQEGFAWAPLSRSSNSRLVPFFVRLEARLGLRRVAPLSPWVGVIAQKVSDLATTSPTKNMV
jgi:SAM-dependent methyltransferase